ncbi:MAG: TolC family protein [Elusimicrobiota bacterium]
MRFLLGLTVFFCASAAFAAEKLTLEEAVNLGLKSNISVLKEEQNVFIAKQQVRESRLIFLPSVVFSADYAKGYLDYPLILKGETGLKYLDRTYDGRDYYSLSGSVILPVYTGGRQRKTLELSKVNYERSKAVLEAETARTALNIKKTFFKALYSYKVLSEVKEAYKKAEALFSKISQDSADYTEALKIKYEIEREMNQADKDRENAVKELKILISKISDFEPEGDFKPYCPYECDENKVSLSAVENSAELKKNIYQSGIDALSVEMAVRRKYPDIFLGYLRSVSGYSVSDLFDRAERLDSQAVFVSLNLPINYDFWTQIQKRKAEERVGELEMLSIRENIKNRAESVCLEYNFYCSALKEGEKKILIVQSLLEGEKNPFLALKKLKILFEFKKTYYSDIYSQREKMFELENLAGK